MNFFLEFDPYNSFPWTIISISFEGNKVIYGSYSTMEEAFRNHFYNTNKQPMLQIGMQS